MAILIDLTSFSGSIGNISAYKRQGSDKTLMRAKGGATKEKIKRSPAFKETRQLNLEWGGCSKAGKLVRNVLEQQMHITDYNISAPLNGLAKLIQSRDTKHEKGERSILFSANRNLLDGFQLNRKTSLDSLIRHSIEFTLSRSLKNADIVIPELIPGINFFPANQFSLCRFIITLGMVPDVTLQGKQYAPAVPIEDLYYKHLFSNWISTNETIPSQELQISLPKAAKLNANNNLLLAIGIEYGNRISDEVVKQYKYLGAGKILRMV